MNRAPIQKWLVAISQNPKWQSIVEDELSEVLGNRMAGIDDMHLLPKLRATIYESLRWTLPIPMGIPHRVEADVGYKEYHLSKDSNIIACDWASSRSSNLYKDAVTFDPSRFLDPSSPHFKLRFTEHPKPQGQTVFGYDHRACIGQDYITAHMFVICATVMHAFNISRTFDPKTAKEVEIDIMKATPHVIPIMVSVDLRFKVRDAQREAKLRAMFANMEVEE